MGAVWRWTAGQARQRPRLPQQRDTRHEADDEPEAAPQAKPRGHRRRRVLGRRAAVGRWVAPQPAQWRHCEPQGSETTPEDLARRGDRRRSSRISVGPSGLVRGEVVKGGGARVDDLDRVRERMRIEHRADEG